jgi:hypothetical protein
LHTAHGEQYGEQYGHTFHDRLEEGESTLMDWRNKQLRRHHMQGIDVPPAYPPSVKPTDTSLGLDEYERLNDPEVQEIMNASPQQLNSLEHKYIKQRNRITSLLSLINRKRRLP